MASNLLAIMPPSRGQTRFLFQDPEEKYQTINYRTTSLVSKPKLRPPKLSQSVEKRQRFNRQMSQTQALQSASKKNSSEYHCTFSQFVEKAHFKEQQRLMQPKKKSSQNSVVSDQVQSYTENITNYRPNQTIDYSGFTINETGDNFFPTTSLTLPAVSQDAGTSSLVVYKAPEAKSLNVSTDYPTQKEVLKMFMKISGHRDQTETFLGDSKNVQKHRKRLVVLQQKRMATLARLKKSFQAKIPKVSLNTEEEVADGASLLQVSIASAQYERFISDGTLIWKNGYADEFIKKTLPMPKKVTQTPFMEHLLRSKHQKTVSQSRAKSQLVERKPESPKKLVSVQLKGQMESLLEKINTANRERPEGVLPIATQDAVLAFAQQLVSVCETEVDSQSMRTPLEPKEVAFKSGYTTQQAISDHQNSERSSNRPVPAKQTVRNGEVILSVFGEKKSLKKQFSTVPDLKKLSKSTRSERKAIKSPDQITLSSNRKVVEARIEVTDFIASNATLIGVSSLNASETVGQSGCLQLQTDDQLEGVWAVHQDITSTYKRRKQHQHWHASQVPKPQEPVVAQQNDFQSLLNVKPIVKPLTPFDYNAFKDLVEQGQNISPASPKAALPADESLLKIVQNQLSKLAISKDYLIAGMENQSLGKINSENYWLNFSRKVRQSLLAQATFDGQESKHVPADSYRYFSVQQNQDAISQEALKNDMSVFTENWGSHANINPFSQLPEMKEPQMSVKAKEDAQNIKKVNTRVALLKLPQASKNDVLDAIQKDLQNQSPSFPSLSKVFAVRPFPLQSKNNKFSVKDRSPKFFRAKEVDRLRTSSEKPLLVDTVSIDMRLQSKEKTSVKPQYPKYSLPPTELRVRTFGIQVAGSGKKDKAEKLQENEVQSPVSLAENKFFVQNDVLRILTAEHLKRNDFSKNIERKKSVIHAQIQVDDKGNYSSISTLPMRPFNKTPLTLHSKRTKMKFKPEKSGQSSLSGNKILDSIQNMSRAAIEIDLAELVTSKQGDVLMDTAPLSQISQRDLSSELKEKETKRQGLARKKVSVVHSSLAIPAEYEQALIQVFSYPNTLPGQDSASFYGLSQRHNSKAGIKLQKKPNIKPDKQPSVENLKGVGVKISERPSRTGSKLASQCGAKPKLL